MRFHTANADVERRGIDVVTEKQDFELDVALPWVRTVETEDTIYQTSQIVTLKELHTAWLSSETASEVWEQRFLEFIAQILPTGEYEHWAQSQQLLPLIEAFYSESLASARSYEPWARITTNVAYYYWRRGNLGLAQENILIALNIREKLWGMEDERTLYSMEILVNILIGRGKYDEAEVISIRMLQRQCRSQHISQCRVLTSMSNLALILLYQGRYRESEELNQRTLKGSEELLGRNHVDTLISVGNLGLVLHSRKRYAEATALHRRALKGFRRISGTRHPFTLTCMSNLARVLQDDQNYSEAERLQCLSLAQKLRLFGADHPSTQASRDELTALLRLRGKHVVASALDQQVLGKIDNMFGLPSRFSWTLRHIVVRLLHRSRYPNIYR